MSCHKLAGAATVQGKAVTRGEAFSSSGLEFYQKLISSVTQPVYSYHYM